VAQILEALVLATRDGLRLPLVYNTGGYDSLEALALLDGVIDIYMPDMKYGDSATAHRYSHVRDYVEVNTAAVREMHRQVGDLVVAADGIAQRGLLVRHLVLPDDLANTDTVLQFLAREISPNTYVNLMDQYRRATGPTRRLRSTGRSPPPSTARPRCGAAPRPHPLDPTSGTRRCEVATDTWRAARPPRTNAP